MNLPGPTRILTGILGALIFTAIFALVLSAPVWIERSGDRVSFDLSAPYDTIVSVVDSVVSGEAFHYLAGTMHRSILREAPRYARNSFLLFFLSSLLGSTIAVAVALGSRTVTGAVSRFIIKAINILPVFALAIFAQVAVAQIFQATGIRLADIGFHGVRSLTLPIIVLGLGASGFLMEALGTAIDEFRRSEFIRFAEAKGLSSISVVIRHLFPAVEYLLRSRLRGYLAYQLTGLFVVERIFSLPGLTRLLFDYAFQSTVVAGTYTRIYQADMVLLGSLLIFLVYIISYFVIRGLFTGIREVLLAIPLGNPTSRSGRPRPGRIRATRPWAPRVLIVTGATAMILFVVLALAGARIAPYDFEYHQTFIRIEDDTGNEELYVSPAPPLPGYLFGTDETGRDMLTLMLNGLSYTLFTAAATSIAAVGTAVLLSRVLFRRTRPRQQGAAIINSVPTFLIAYYILVSITIDPPFGPVLVAAIQGGLLALLSIPRLVVYLNSALRQVEALPYIDAAGVSGADRRWIFHKHLLPAIYGDIAVLCSQELTRILEMFGFLALFRMYLGGTGVTIYPTLYFPLVYDWAGLIGRHIGNVYSARWLLVYPLAGYIILIASASLLARGTALKYSRGTSHS